MRQWLPLILNVEAVLGLADDDVKLESFHLTRLASSFGFFSLSISLSKYQQVIQNRRNGKERMESFAFEILLHSFARTSFAHASVLNDFGRSIGAPIARSMINCDRTPKALDVPKSTV